MKGHLNYPPPSTLLYSPLPVSERDVASAGVGVLVESQVVLNAPTWS